MNEVQIKDYVAGGYFLTEYVSRSEYMSPELLPTQIISASTCIATTLPAVWTVESLENPRKTKWEARSYNVAEDKLPKVLEWVNERYNRDVGFPNIFYSVRTARDFANRFYNDSKERVILGIALAPAAVREFLEEEQANYGVYDCLKKGDSLAADGEILGYELLGYEFGEFHSWLCNSLEKDAYDEFEIRPNNYGFIGTFEEAEKCAEYALREEVGAEPVLWQSWLVVEYQVNT